MTHRAVTVRQPYADLTVAGVVDVLNMARPVPSTLPQWHQCGCGHRASPDAERPYGDPREHTPSSLVRCGPQGPVGPYPFRLGIHAASQVAPFRGHQAAWNALPHPEAVTLERKGALVGWVTVTRQHHADKCRHDQPGSFPLHVGRTRETTVYPQAYCSPWALPDCWHYALADPVPLDEPVPMRGQTGLWRLPEGTNP